MQWEEAQHIGSKNKRDTVRRSADGEVSIFAGIVKCADCGGNMIFNRKVYKSSISEFYRCGTYQQKGKNICSTHRINYPALYQAVLSDIQEYAVLTVEDEQTLIDRILKSNNDFKAKSALRYEKNIRETKNRIREIDSLLQNLYEDKVAGEVTSGLFKRMTVKYEAEREKGTFDLQQMETELTECQRVQQDLTGWITRIRECLTIKTLTRALVVELIDRIEVGETYDNDRGKTINIEIFYKFGLKGANHDRAKENRAS